MASKASTGTKLQKKKTAAATKNGKSVSYRMRCSKTANGLSHFVMYGDIKEKETLL